MIILLYGGNELAIQRRLRELRELADGGSGMLDSNQNIIDGRDAKPNDILAAAMSLPFLSPMRLVVVERVFERFQGRRAGRGEPATPKGWEPLLAALEAGIPESTILVFLGLPYGSGQNAETIGPGNQLVARLGKIPGVLNEHKAAIDAKEIPQFVRERAHELGIRFRPGKFPERLAKGEAMPDESDPAQLIANLCQSDTMSIANELKKLALYSNGDDVTVAEVNRVCAGERTATAFNFRDAVLDGDLGKALEFKTRLLRDGEALAGLLFMLTDGYRRTVPIVDGLENGASEEELGRLMGNAGKYPRLRADNIRRAKHLQGDHLRVAFEHLVEADRTNKLGEVDEEVAFDILLAKLCELARSPALARPR